LVQGVLKNAWSLSHLQSAAEDDSVDVYWGEGAAYTASLLPLLNECNREDAKYLDMTMKVANDSDDGDGGTGKKKNNKKSGLLLDPKRIDYELIVQTLERNYECLGITAELVGQYQGPKESSTSTTSTSLRGKNNDDDHQNNKKPDYYVSKSTTMESSELNGGSAGRLGSQTLSIIGIGIVVVVFGFIARRRGGSRHNNKKSSTSATSDNRSRLQDRRRYYLEREPLVDGGDGIMIELSPSSPSRTIGGAGTRRPSLDPAEPFLEPNLDDSDDEESVDLDEEEYRQLYRSANKMPAVAAANASSSSSDHHQAADVLTSPGMHGSTVMKRRLSRDSMDSTTSGGFEGL
jgi:hypothetical protein